MENLGITVSGLVQGVGFRPFVYRLALKHELHGSVENRNDGVFIQVHGSKENMGLFLKELETNNPPLSQIRAIKTVALPPSNGKGFRIVPSRTLSQNITQVSPDVAVCPQCLKDMETDPRRIDYPFTNCTNCGPRFSITRQLPYDRPFTTMASFRMCRECQREYDQILNRRFHAQPNCCTRCGPGYELLSGKGRIKEIKTIIRIASQLLCQGKILAIKGIGGFHLACNAQDEKAVRALRERKLRDGKPFALMCRDLNSAKKYAQIDPGQEAVLTSPKRPILLLQKTKDLAPSALRGLEMVGIMLPYAPLHHLLFKELPLEVLVMTSGNRADEPVIIRNQKAEELYPAVADGVLTYNRDIYNRQDDSVVQMSGQNLQIIRRARGWTPEPVPLSQDAEGVLAVGAELKSTFCLGKGSQAFLSQHLGDLKSPAAFSFFQEAYTHLKELFQFHPQVVACDLHPDFLSTRFAKDQALPLIQVQHHYAHLASCMAEHGLEEAVIGVSFDGTGLGTDGKIWGGEFLVCDWKGFTRWTHLAYLPQPGGDLAARQPWRMALAYLRQTYGTGFADLDLPFSRAIPERELSLVRQAMEKDINSPLTSSVGRLFDAVSALLNLVPLSTFEAEAPIRLEQALRPGEEGYYPFEIKEQIGLEAMIEEIVRDLRHGVSLSVISARFHNTLVELISQVVKKMARDTGIRTVCLSGGVFLNRYLWENSCKRLANSGFTVYSNSAVPPNDGGISLGQLAVAAHAIE